MPNHKIEYPRAEDSPVPNLPLSPAVCYGDLIFVSGQASVDRTGKIVSGTFEEEFRRSMENIEQILRDSGSDLSHVLQTRNYVRDEEDLPAFQALYREYFKPPYPARTTITSCLGANLRYEIDCVAVKA